MTWSDRRRSAAPSPTIDGIPRAEHSGADDQPLFPELEEADLRGLIFVTQSGKEARKLCKLGYPAIFHRGGFERWDDDECNTPLKDLHLVIVPHNDTRSVAAAQRVTKSAARTAASVRILHLPGLPSNGGVVEWRKAGGTRAQLDALVSASECVTGTSPSSGGCQASNSTERWQAVPLSELKAPLAEDSWIWTGYLVPGSTTLLVGLWKGGKTTLVSYLLRALAPPANGGARDFAGQTIEAANVLVVTEEPARVWRRRRDALRLGDHVRIISRPFMGLPKLQEWTAFLAYVKDVVRKQKITLVVFDALPHLWPVVHENDSGEVLAAVRPLHMLTEAGASVLLVHHPRKGDAAEGQASRGAGGLPAFVDIIVELRRYDAERRDDTRRVLSTFSRFDESPGELVVYFEKGVGYSRVGTKGDARTVDRLDVALDLLKDRPPGRTPEELLARWPDDAAVPRPSKRTLRRDLELSFDQGRLGRTGTGRKGDAFRYYRNSIPDSPDSYRAERHKSSNRRGFRRKVHP